MRDKAHVYACVREKGGGNKGTKREEVREKKNKMEGRKRFNEG